MFKKNNINISKDTIEIDNGETIVYLCNISDNAIFNNISLDSDLIFISDDINIKNTILKNIKSEENILDIIQSVSMYDNYDLKYFPNKKINNSNKSINFENVILLDNHNKTYEYNDGNQWVCTKDNLTEKGLELYKNFNNPILLTFIKY